MPLFRKKSQSQAQRLASWRSEALSGRAAATARRAARGARRAASEERDGWVVEVGGGRLFIATIDDGTTLSGWVAARGHARRGRARRRCCGATSTRGLVWTSRSDAGGEDELGARFAVPLDGFDRGAVLLALETMAGALGDEALAARARDAREPPRGEAGRAGRERRAAEAVHGGAGGDRACRAEADPERPGASRSTTAASSRRSCATRARACC